MNSSPLQRNESESISDFLIRLGSNRELYDIDWNDICKIMNTETEENWNESKHRKDFHAAVKWRDYWAAKQSDELTREIRDTTLELQKEKFKFQDQKREYTNVVRQQARFEHLKDEINKSIKELALVKPLTFSVPSSTRSSVKANILWSDWHVGMDFSNSLNTYNLNVFKQRLQKLVVKTIEYGLKHNVNTLTIGALGDFLSGGIHVSTRVQSSEDVIRQVQIVSESISESVAELSKHFRSIKFINIIGNHARTSPNKTESILKENFEYLIPWYMETRLKDFVNIEIHKDTDGYFIDDTFSSPHVYVHGDLDQVTSVAKNLPQVLGIVPSHIFCGHIHHETVKDYGRTKVISNGSLIGVDDYAISKRFFAEPMQKMHIFDGNRIEYSINIDVN